MGNVSAPARVEPEKRAAYHRAPNPWLVQAAVGIASILITIDSTGINVALYTIAGEYGIDMGTASWLPLVSFLMISSTLLLFGKVSSQLGPKNVFAAGIALFGSAAAAAGLAPSFPALLLCRALQALGGSMITANQIVIIAASVPPHQRGAAIGVWNAIVGLGTLLGPTLAGVLIDLFSWRYLFLGLAPLAALSLVVSIVVLPPSERSKGQRFDYGGAALLALATTSLLLGIDAARRSSPASPAVLGLIGLAALALVAFVQVERRTAEPLLDLSLFRIRLFSLALLAAFFLFLAFAAQELLLPLFVQDVLRAGPATAGILMTVAPLIRVLMSSPAGYLSDRFGPRPLMMAGAITMAIGMLGLSSMNASTSTWFIVACLVLIGLGTGMFFPPSMHAVMASIPPSQAGIGSAAVGLRRNLGQSVGIALAAYLLQTGSTGADGSVGGYRLAFLVGTVWLALATLAAFAAGPLRKTKS